MPEAFRRRTSNLFGLVWTYLGPAEKEPPFQRHRFMDAPEDKRCVIRVNVKANYLQLWEGGADSSHVGILHSDVARPGWLENTFVPTNPTLLQPLSDVAAMLRKEYEPKRAEILDATAKIYAQHFTEQELKDIIAFFKTPVGKKMLAQEPIAIDDSLKAAQNWANAFSEVVLDRFRTEMKKKGFNL